MPRCRTFRAAGGAASRELTAGPAGANLPPGSGRGCGRSRFLNPIRSSGCSGLSVSVISRPPLLFSRGAVRVLGVVFAAVWKSLGAQSGLSQTSLWLAGCLRAAAQRQLTSLQSRGHPRACGRLHGRLRCRLPVPPSAAPGRQPQPGGPWRPLLAGPALASARVLPSWHTSHCAFRGVLGQSSPRGAARVSERSFPADHSQTVLGSRMSYWVLSGPHFCVSPQLPKVVCSRSAEGPGLPEGAGAGGRLSVRGARPAARSGSERGPSALHTPSSRGGAARPGACGPALQAGGAGRPAGTLTAAPSVCARIRARET